MNVVAGIVLFIRAVFVSRATIAVENLALRHQLGVLQRSVKRSQLRQRDRIFWAWLSRLWPDWRDSLAIVKPATVNGSAVLRLVQAAGMEISRQSSSWK